MKIQDLKFGYYYVANIAFNMNNPIHRCIVSDVCNAGNIDRTTINVMRSGYEPQIITIPVKQLAYLEIICEISEMDPKNDCYLLPAEQMARY